MHTLEALVDKLKHIYIYILHAPLHANELNRLICLLNHPPPSLWKLYQKLSFAKRCNDIQLTLNCTQMHSDSPTSIYITPFARYRQLRPQLCINSMYVVILCSHVHLLPHAAAVWPNVFSPLSRALNGSEG